jgi:hypothetical protein
VKVNATGRVLTELKLSVFHAMAASFDMNWRPGVRSKNYFIQSASKTRAHLNLSE